MNIEEQEKDICEFSNVEDEAYFLEHAGRLASGLAIVAEPQTELNSRLLKADAGDLAKWIRKEYPNINVHTDIQNPKLVLRSAEYWLPLVFLASDISLPIYLNIVASYLYEKMRGSLKGDTSRVHLNVEYTRQDGSARRFSFTGDASALQKVIKRFDLNEFLDEK